MSTAVETQHLTIALIGNPNTGKSTLFTALAGVRQHVGNYPGVTVEKKTGTVLHKGRHLKIVDLPGTYSLSPRSADEMITVKVMLGRVPGVPAPDCVLSIIDASNLERNLFLLSQVLDFGLPVVVALNMVDIAARRQVSIDSAELARRLGVPVVPIEAHRRKGIDDLLDALVEAAGQKAQCQLDQRMLLQFPAAFRDEVERLGKLSDDPGFSHRAIIERLLLDPSGWLEQHISSDNLREALRDSRRRLHEGGCPVHAIESDVRYGWAAQMLDGLAARPAHQVSGSDRLDRVLTNRFFGTIIFLVLMAIVFQSIYTWAAPVMDWIDSLVSLLGEWLGGRLPPGPLQSLLVDGVIAGGGAVIVFLPQIAILFFFIALLEDCGYLARAAFLMDRIMSRIGLSGKAFIPLMSSFACAVPGIMATRVIEDRRDRLVTILVAPLMSCSARLPVYVLLIGAFIPPMTYLGGWIGLQGLVLLAMHCVGAVVAIPVALITRRWIMKGETPPFVMELPCYKLPSLRNVVMRVWDQVAHFLKDAGTIIFWTTIVVWAALYFPRSPEIDSRYAAMISALQQRVPAESRELHKELERLRDAEHLEKSFMGRAGHLIEPLVRPLGWDWKIGMATIASFPAREVVVATLGTVYSLGGNEDENSGSLRQAIRQEPWAQEHPIAVALSIMVFFALCAQCAATLAVIRRETNSWFWPGLCFSYMTGLAYIAALVTFQVASHI